MVLVSPSNKSLTECLWATSETVRDRDSLKQIRIPIDTLKATLAAKLTGEPFNILPPGGSKCPGFDD